jgi:D-alanine--poly(phosphoribitol) ligase subunit 1
MAFISNLGLAFDAIVQKHADRVALIYPATDERVSYRELKRQVDHLCGVLWAKGLRRGAVVAIFHDKSPAAFAMMLACLRLGVIYTNLDPDSPWERLRKILVTCQPRLVVNGFLGLPHGPELAVAGFTDVLHLQDVAGWPCPEVPAEGLAVDGGAPAYIMFTSGSTGMPKGAVMSHANLLWFIGWAQERFSVTSGDVFSNVNPIYFDNSVFDFYTAIFSGAALVPVMPVQVQDTRLVVQLLNTAGCTVWFSVPSLLVYLLTTRALSGLALPAVRKIIFGGEGFPKAKLRQLFDIFGARAALENVYGPTECTCICSAYTISETDFDDMQSLAPLGLLAQNFSYEILPLDVADSNSGELLLRGPQVGLGYYNDPERSGKAFVQNPRHRLYADMGYRTGDLVFKDARGWLHFKGRSDFQIKHMGYRVELEEIEAALGTVPKVEECAVIYQKLGDGLGQILAFVAITGSASDTEIRDQLAAIVPPYMVPRRVTILAQLPKNANGKIDRIALQSQPT